MWPHPLFVTSYHDLHHPSTALKIDATLSSHWVLLFCHWSLKCIKINRVSLEIVMIARGLFSLYLFLIMGNLQRKFIISQFFTLKQWPSEQALLCATKKTIAVIAVLSHDFWCLWDHENYLKHWGVHILYTKTGSTVQTMQNCTLQVNSP